MQGANSVVSDNNVLLPLHVKLRYHCDFVCECCWNGLILVKTDGIRTAILHIPVGHLCKLVSHIDRNHNRVLAPDWTLWYADTLHSFRTFTHFHGFGKQK